MSLSHLPNLKFMDLQGCNESMTIASFKPLRDHCDVVIEPGHAQDFNTDGFTPLHLACREGHLEIMKKLIQTNRELCFLKDKFGGTPLHTAAMKGRVEAVKALLEACPECVKEVTATGETCLHTAVVYNKFKVIQYLVKWLGERTADYGDLVNGKDWGGNTALHLATSRKQLQTLKVLLTYNPSISNLVNVNAMNSGGFTALDILDVLPYRGKIDMEIDKLLRQAGASRARDIASHGNKKHDAVYGCRRGCHQLSHLNTTKNITKPRGEYAYYVLLVTATLLATITYRAAFSPPGVTVKEVYKYDYDVNGILQLKKRDSVITRSFILFNSTGFITSVAMIIFLLHEFPLKPWPQISVSTFFGSYMCSIMATSPSEASALLFLAIPFLLLAAMGKMYGFARQKPCESSCYGDDT